MVAVDVTVLPRLGFSRDDDALSLSLSLPLSLAPPPAGAETTTVVPAG